MSLREEDEADAENTDAVDRDSVPADDLALEIQSVMRASLNIVH